VSKRLFIIIRAPNGDVREVPISEDPVVIGRDESADVRVDDKKISRRHASFRIVDGEPTVEDLSSANGIKLNGKKIERRSKFKLGDSIKVGTFQITLKDPADNTASSASDGPVIRKQPVMEKVGQVVDPAGSRGRQPKEPNREVPALIGLDDPVQGRRFELKVGENIIGRLEECDVPILDGSVSRQHSRLVFTRDRLTVTDLGSSNGTFVNDTRVDMAELAHKDRLRAGNINFDVQLPERLRGRASGPVQTRARPESFAEYSAASAAPTTSSGSAWRSALSATPMLTLIVATASSRRSFSATAAASSWAVSGSRTANSSPP